MSARREEAMAAFGRLLDIMDDLRAKCPWDREQTFESLRHLTVEETYELADALAAGDLKETQKELGDLFLHLVFYAKLGSEVGAFDVVDVLEGIAAKLIHRHPHIYGDVRADDADAVKANWEAIKLKEGKKSVLEGVPKSLPALIKANRLQDKVKGVGFDWLHKAEVWAKVEEELGEFREAEAQNDPAAMESELGDVFFSLVNYARHAGVDPDLALSRANTKFQSRFEAMERLAAADGKAPSDLDLAAWEAYWNRVKLTER